MRVGRLTEDPTTRVATVTGRDRLPADVVSELQDVLADEPRIVVCDLTRMAPNAAAMVEMFTPVNEYLANWPGTLVVLCVPDPEVHARALPAAIAERLLVHASGDTGLAEAQRLLRPLERAEIHLAPTPTAARDARHFTTRTLLDWQLSVLIGPAGLVVSELVTNAVVHAVTVIDLTLSRVDTTVRVAVHDRGGGRPALSGGSPEHVLERRGLVLVQAFARCWGVFPRRARGKTVWALLDSTVATPLPSQRARALS